MALKMMNRMIKKMINDEQIELRAKGKPEKISKDE